MKPRVAWIAMGIALALHLLLGVGQSQGWIPGETRWLGVGAVRREWRAESRLGSIERYRDFCRRWLDDAERLPMSQEEFLDQESRAWSSLIGSLAPDVHWRRTNDRFEISPAYDAPFRRFFDALGRFRNAVIGFYDEKSRGDLTEVKRSLRLVEEALDGLRSTVGHDR